jgi:hypothetical protein
MITLQECLDFSDLNEDEIHVIAEHERVPEIVAAEMGHALLQTPKGVYQIRQFLLEELERAKLAGHKEKARRIDQAITRFVAAHPLPRVL